MHFTFTYVSHHIEELQEYLDFLFFEVWCKADGEFDVEKLNGNEKLKLIYIDLGNQEGKWANFFNGSIESIYREFLKLNNPYKALLSQSYKNNNDIEQLCIDISIAPITYDDIERDHPTLSKALKDFYSKLYGNQSPFNLKVFGFLNKDLIANYDREFMNENNEGICPFCGLTHLKGNNHSYREAYDHYIPKGIYPFNALNFKNLAPMCHECNSTYKLTKSTIYKKQEKNIDPLKREEGRMLAFYPYATNHPKLTFGLVLKSRDIKNLKPKDIDLTVEAENCEEQILSWKRVFGINERYKALLCNENEGKAWVGSILDEYENAAELSEIEDADQYYKCLVRAAEKYPLSSYGFIKSVFLEECKKQSVFDVN